MVRRHEAQGAGLRTQDSRSSAQRNFLLLLLKPNRKKDSRTPHTRMESAAFHLLRDLMKVTFLLCAAKTRFNAYLTGSGGDVLG